MSSIVAPVAHAAHSAVASLFAAAQIKPGQELPKPGKGAKVKASGSADPSSAFELGPFEGKRVVIVGVPGAWTGTCHAQVPGYIENFERFKEKGVDEIYIVAVNDAFTVKAWEDNLKGDKPSPVKFIADDQGLWTASVGLLFDATPLLGGPRSKRYVIITTKEGTVESVIVEQNPGELTITDAKTVLANLS
ncbi:Redoxin-domain-containing protein [Schizophyllum commune Tattone D]|nr:Redoxin-domain-containing protein [Schizophyllum commune Tattone D]